MRRPLLFEHLRTAIDSLRLTRTRTSLTILGITIGIASVTSIVILSHGLSSVLGGQVSQMGDNLSVVRPASLKADVNSVAAPISQQGYSTSTLTEQDYINIRNLDGVAAAAPLMTINGTPRAGGTTVANSVVVATTPALAETTDLPIREGQFIDSVTTRNTAVIGSQMAIDLFGTDVPIGQTFTLRGQDFTVIGVLRPTHNPINYNNIDFDHTIIVGLEDGKTFHQGTPQIQQINVKAKDANKLADITRQIDAKLTHAHSGEKDFTIVHGQDIARPTGQFFTTVTAVMTAIAAISLLVGGIGVMNIMLVGVAERTREIGLRKAVGASNANIIGQFMTESLLMTLCGGVLGIILGYLIALSIGSFVMLVPEFHWMFIVVGLGVAVGVGLLFGLFPAIKAARKDPIESLRQYH